MNAWLIKFNYVTKLKNNNLKKTNEEFIIDWTWESNYFSTILNRLLYFYAF